MKEAVSSVLKDIKPFGLGHTDSMNESHLTTPSTTVGWGNTIFITPPPQRKKIKRWVFFVDVFLEENYDFNVFELIFFIYIFIKGVKA